MALHRADGGRGIGHPVIDFPAAGVQGLALADQM